MFRNTPYAQNVLDLLPIHSQHSSVFLTILQNLSSAGRIMGDLQLRMFDAKRDYAMLSLWWKSHKWEPVRQDALSGFGMIAETDFEAFPLCAGWLYLTTSTFSLIEFVVTNPTAPLKLKYRGVELLIARLITEAQGFGSKLIFTSLQSKSLIRLYCRQGFKVTDQGMTNLVHTGETK